MPQPHKDKPARSRTLLSGVFARTSDKVEHLALEMDTAEPTRAAVIAGELLKLGEKKSGQSAWDELAHRLHLLTEGQRERVIAAGAEQLGGWGGWGGVAQRLVSSPSHARRQSCARLAQLSLHPDAVLTLPALLADPEADVRAAALAALTSLIHNATRGVGLPEAARAALDTALAAALDTFDQHRTREVLVGAMELLATPARRNTAAPSLAKWLTLDDHIAHMPARAAMRAPAANASTSPAPSPAPSLKAAVNLLSTPPLRAACSERLLSASSRAEFDELLESAHLFTHPSRAACWAAAVASRPADAQAMFADERFIEPVSDRAARRVPAVLAASESPTAWNVAVGVLIDPRPHTRLALVRAAAAAQSASTTAAAPISDIFVDASLDQSPPVARSALLAALSPRARASIPRVSLLKLCTALSRSPHAQVRDLAITAASAMDPWSGATAHSRLHARRLLRRDRAGFVLALRRRIIESSPSERVSTLQLARALDLAPDVETELLSIVRASLAPRSTPASSTVSHTEAQLRVVATAVTLLGECTSPASGDMLVSACAHADARIRANALDAIWRRLRAARSAQSPAAASSTQTAEHAADLFSSIVEFKHDPHHRVRASAIRAELFAPPTVRSAPRSGDDRVRTLLIPMLTDSRPMHRVAGLWLAERAASAPSDTRRTQTFDVVSGVVASMIGSDPSPEVRRRARRCAQRIIARTAL